MAPSTAHPAALPDIFALRRLTQSLAMLDAVLCPEWEFRYHSFNARWSEGAQLASMRNGSGDDWFLLFEPACGAVLKGFAHESPLARDKIYAEQMRAALPAEFQGFLNEPAFSVDNVTFCLWRRLADLQWQAVPRANGLSEQADDGSAAMLRILDGVPFTYLTWAEDYYEQEISLAGVQALYAHQPLTPVLLGVLNSQADWTQCHADAIEINYPCSENV